MGTRLGSIGELIYLYISILLLLCVVLDLPTTAFGWPNTSVVPHGDKARVDPAPVPCQSSQTGSEPEDIGEPTTSTGEEPGEDWGITLLVTACRSILQYITVYHSILQHITVYHSILQHITVYHSISQHTTVYYSISQYITVYHSISQYITVYHSILQYITVYHSISQYITVLLALFPGSSIPQLLSHIIQY